MKALLCWPAGLRNLNTLAHFRPSRAFTRFNPGYWLDKIEASYVKTDPAQIAQDKGIDLDWEVLKVEVPADRIWKDVFYIPALLLLAFIRVLQKGRARTQEMA